MNETQLSKKSKNKRRKKSVAAAVSTITKNNNNNVKKTVKRPKIKQNKKLMNKKQVDDSDSEFDFCVFSDNDDDVEDSELLNDVEKYIKTLGFSKINSTSDSEESELDFKTCKSDITSPKKKKLKDRENTKSCKSDNEITSPKKKKFKEIENMNTSKSDNDTTSPKNKKFKKGKEKLDIVTKTSTELKDGTVSEKGNKNNSKETLQNNNKQNISKHNAKSIDAQNRLEKGNICPENTQTKMVSSNSCQDKKKEIMDKLKKQLQSASFRLINEKLYTSSGNDAYEMFKEDPKSFQVYHEGYSQQVAEWPVNPLDSIIAWVRKKPRNWVIADFGCGSAKLAKSVSQKVISLDLIASAPKVIECNMAHTPLEDKSMNVVVFCLSLMGTNLTEFIIEANRVLVMRGVLKIAEIESRFENRIGKFLRVMNMLGFECIHKNQNQNYFWLFEFIKVKSVKFKANSPELILKPCMYKKR